MMPGYTALPTMAEFHKSGGQIRCIVGPVGSGKTSTAAVEICAYLPQMLFDRYGITKTKWAIVRNTYTELRDTTQETVFEWFPRGVYHKQANEYVIQYNDFEVKLLFRSCDRPGDIKKFKSLEITGYWIDESIEIIEQIKNMLKTRIGRFPQKCPVRFGIESTNPPDVEHPLYSQFDWNVPPPGPLPAGLPLPKHFGFWQPPGENDDNLRPGYYDDLRSDYRDYPDWIEMYIEGKPGVMVLGKLVYNNFRRAFHVAKEPIPWTGGKLYMGWDNTGLCPACVVVQVPTPKRVQILREYHTDKMGIVDFTRHVIAQVNMAFPGAPEILHWGDPAGAARFSKKEGGFTSNAELMHDEGVTVKGSEQNLRARIEAVDQMLDRINGVLIDPSCTRLINGFIAGYCHPPNLSIMGEYMETILKNKYSHIHDALQYILVKLFKPVIRRDLIDPRPAILEGQRDKYDPLEHFSRGR